MKLAQVGVQHLAWPVVALVALSVLWSGTVDRPATLVLSAAFAVVVCVRVFMGARYPFSLFAKFLLLACAWMALQCVPLPPVFRSFFPRPSDAVLQQVLQNPQAWLPISLDPAETFHELARLLGGLCLLLSLGRTAQSILWLLTIVVLGLVVAGLGVLGRLGVGLPAPFGVVDFGQSRALWPAVLQNANHMAALLTVSATLLVGLLMNPAQPKPNARGWHPRARDVGWAALVFLNLALCATLSRSGLVVGFLGQLVTFLCVRGSKRAGLAGLGVAGVSLLFCTALGLFSPLFHRFSRLFSDAWAPGSKFWLWQTAWPLLRGHLWLGIGRGAFETALDLPDSFAARLRFTHLENEWLQTLFDFGVPVGCVLIALLLAAVFEALKQVRRLRSPMHTAALVALCGLGVSNLFDFSLSTGALAAVAIVLAAVVQKNAGQVSGRWLFVPGLLCLGCVFFAHFRLPGHEQDGARLRQLAQDPTVATDHLVREAARATLRHPMDSYLSAVVAARLSREGHKDALRFANRALLQHSGDRLARMVAAQELLRHGHKRQALQLVGPLLVHVEADFRPRIAELVLACHFAPSELFSVLPDEPLGRQAVLQVAMLRTPPDWPLVLALAQAAVQKGDAFAWVFWGRAALALSIPKDAEAVLGTAVQEPFLWAGLIELVARSGKPGAARLYAEAALLQKPTSELHLAAAVASFHLNDWDQALWQLRSAFEKTEAPFLRLRIHELTAEVEQKRGNPHRAAWERDQAEAIRKTLKETL